MSLFGLYSEVKGHDGRRPDKLKVKTLDDSLIVQPRF